MATEKKEGAADEAELIVVEGTAEGAIETIDDKADKEEKVEDKTLADKQKELKDDAAKDDKGGDKDDEDDEDEDEGDARASSEAEADKDDEAKNKKDRESSAQRRQRQREARERLERERNYYQQRNEQLERRQSAIETRQFAQEKLTIKQALDQVEQQLKEVKRIEAEAIAEADGNSAVEARDIAAALNNKRDRLLQAQARAERPPQDTSTTPPPAMEAAFNWIKANKDWYDPKGGNEDSALASAIEDHLFREGRFDPATSDFWEELDKRLKARGIGKKAAVDEDEDEDDNAASDAAHRGGNGKSTGERKDAHTKSNGGPKISINGASRALKANEVYISPDRKKAMQELGVWDDPVLRQKMLKDYQRYDREAANAARN